jgi:hypothetical protein
MIRVALLLSVSAFVYFAGLALIAEGVEAKQSQVCSAPRPKGPPGSCNDCKDAFKRLTLTED